jgi:hypothetical protein
MFQDGRIRQYEKTVSLSVCAHRFAGVCVETFERACAGQIIGVGNNWNNWGGTLKK